MAEKSVTFTLMASLVNSVNPEQRNLVLAFRTISTVLAAIQKGPLGIDVGSIAIHKPIPSTLELKILTALATVLVRQHEIVAVSSRVTGNPTNVDVVACASHYITATNPRDPKVNLPVPGDAMTLETNKDFDVLTPGRVDIDAENPLLFVKNTW